MRQVADLLEAMDKDRNDNISLSEMQAFCAVGVDPITSYLKVSSRNLTLPSMLSRELP